MKREKIMLKEINSTYLWPSLLVIALFFSTTISQASIIRSGLSDDVDISLLNNPTTMTGHPVSLENSVVYENARVVSSKNKAYTGYFNKRVKLKETGTYQASLSDFNFPINFDLLGLSVSSSTKKMGEIWNNGSFNFQADAGKYFLNLVYKTDETLNLGKYGVKLQYIGTSAVPLPASLWLMLTGMAAIISYRRKPN